MRLLTVHFVLLATLAAMAAAADYRLDDELFRRGLIDRGFDELLAVYDQGHPPEGDLDLFNLEIAQAWLGYRRAEGAADRSERLEKLLGMERERIATYRNHPLTATWRVRYANDLLSEKHASAVFLLALGLTLPDDAAERLPAGLDEIEGQLGEAREFLDGELSRFRGMDDQALAEANRAGLPELYGSSLLQARYLSAWTQFWRLDLLPSIQRVKVLYSLRDLLAELEATELASEQADFRVLQAAVHRRLGSVHEAGRMLEAVSGPLPPVCGLLAELERVRLAVELKEYSRAEALAQAIDLSVWPQGYQRDLVDLTARLMRGRIGLAQLGEEACERGRREAALAEFSNALAARPELAAMFEREVVELGDCPAEAMADVEVYLRAALVRREGRVEEAISLARGLVARGQGGAELVVAARRLLADCLAQTQRFGEAAAVLADQVNEGQELSEAALAQYASFAWRAYEQSGQHADRRRFVEAASGLLAQYPKTEQGDRFRLLLADQLGQSGRWREGLACLDAVESRSESYLEAQAARVLILTRRFGELSSSTTEPTAGETLSLAQDILAATQRMLSAVGTAQAKPDEVASWQLPLRQLNLVAGAVLACDRVLRHQAVGRADEAKQLTSLYAPLIEAYEKANPAALPARVLGLAEEATSESLAEAVVLATRMLAIEEIVADRKAETVATVLAAVHRRLLADRAEPVVTDPPGLAVKAADLSLRTIAALGEKAGVAPARRLAALRTIAAADAGRYEQVPMSADGAESPEAYRIDLRLAAARASLVREGFTDAANISMEVIGSVSPGDLRHWHGLVVNLTAHMRLGSDPQQVAAAIMARQQQFPDLGNAATRSELLGILEAARPQP
ncbi:MAG: hypothetical protein GXY33_10235 [Phycisphaerae bacterium]|nr:hypothetical protein [Phycisphaerae bacterium]